jgi:hypothetical protein
MNVLPWCWGRQHFSSSHVIWLPIPACTFMASTVLFHGWPVVRHRASHVHPVICQLHPCLFSTPPFPSYPDTFAARARDSWREESGRELGTDLVCFICSNCFQAFLDYNLMHFSELLTNHFYYQPQCPILGRKKVNSAEKCCYLKPKIAPRFLVR